MVLTALRLRDVNAPLSSTDLGATASLLILIERFQEALDVGS